MTYNNYNHDEYINSHKPTQPTLKVGDWVYSKYDYRKPKLKQITSINENYLCFRTGVRDKPVANYIKGQPKEGEWCMFFSMAEFEPVENRCGVLAQFDRTVTRISDWHYCKGTTDAYLDVAPYVGELPTWCK